jgi:beta-xylosidase
MTRLLLIMVVMVLGACTAARPRDVGEPANPIIPGWYADPEGVVFDGTVWIYPTRSRPYDEQLGFDAFSSTDLVHWQRHDDILDRASFPWIRRACWAPSVVKNNGRYYFFFAANDIQKDGDEKANGGIGVGVGDSPTGPFKDLLGKPLLSTFHHGAQPIDQFVFRDTDGSWYMFYGGWGHCVMTRLRDDFTGFVPLPNGETFREITPEGYVEGPFMFIRNNVYYFMWSEGGWTGPNYRVAYAMATSVHGPWKRMGTILEQDPAIATGAGHHSVVQVGSPEADDYRIVYHRRPLGHTAAEHRVVCMDRLTFDAEGRILPVKMTKGE